VKERAGDGSTARTLTEQPFHTVCYIHHRSSDFTSWNRFHQADNPVFYRRLLKICFLSGNLMDQSTCCRRTLSEVRQMGIRANQRRSQRKSLKHHSSINQPSSVSELRRMGIKDLSPQKLLKHHSNITTQPSVNHHSIITRLPLNHEYPPSSVRPLLRLQAVAL
jgi:hypothetical protein